jgi:hypothetical protein
MELGLVSIIETFAGCDSFSINNIQKVTTLGGGLY